MHLCISATSVHKRCLHKSWEGITAPLTKIFSNLIFKACSHSVGCTSPMTGRWHQHFAIKVPNKSRSRPTQGSKRKPEVNLKLHPSKAVFKMKGEDFYFLTFLKLNKSRPVQSEMEAALTPPESSGTAVDQCLCKGASRASQLIRGTVVHALTMRTKKRGRG